MIIHATYAAEESPIVLPSRASARKLLPHFDARFRFIVWGLLQPDF